MKALGNIPLQKGEYIKAVSAAVAPPDWGADTTRWFRDQHTVTSSPDIDAWVEENAAGNATQGTPDDKPHLVTSVINGQPVVRFDGVDDYLDVGDALQATWRTDFIIGFVVDITQGQPAAQQTWFATRNSANEDRVLFGHNTNGSVIVAYESNNNTTTFRTAAGFLSSGDNGSMGFTIWADKAGDNTLKLYRSISGITTQLTDDGVLDGDLTGITMGDWTSTDNMYLGCRNKAGTPDNFSSIDMAEWWAAKNGTAARVTALGSYFVDRYSL